MQAQIYSLPSELIGQILGYDVTSYLSIALWLTGNRALQRKLSTSVDYIELRNGSQFDVCFMPKLLPNLRSLRHLIIHRAAFDLNHHLFDHPRTVSVLRELPEAMESIILRFRDSSLLFFPSEDSSSPHISVNEKFPQLKRLHLDMTNEWTPSHLHQLPSTITDLQIVLPEHPDAIQEVMTALPPQLLSLSMLSIKPDRFGSFLKLLPPNLVNLMLIDVQYPSSIVDSDFSELPRSLVHLRTCYFHCPPDGRSVIDSDSMYNSPSLSLPSIHDPRTVSLPPNFSGVSIVPEADLQSLPPHIQSLELHKPIPTAQYIRYLPRRLTSLTTGVAAIGNWKASDFPSALASLTITRDLDLSLTSSPHFAFLPLTKLSIFQYEIPMAHVANFPPTLLSLQIVLQDLDDSIQFPNNLTHLTISGTYLGLYGVLDANGALVPGRESLTPDWTRTYPQPSSDQIVTETFRLAQLRNCRVMKTLSISNMPIPMGDLVYLPDELTQLNLSFLVPDLLFDSTSPAAIARVMHLLDIAHETEKRDFWPLGQKQQVTLCHLMPRSMIHLSLHGDLALPNAAWSALPRLRSLALHGTHFDQEILEHLPLNHISSLRISLADLDDAHVRLFPSSIHLNLALATDKPTLTERSYYCIPLLVALEERRRSDEPSRPRMSLVNQLEEDGDFEALQRLVKEKDLA